jgi:hypothetical protein
LADYLHSTGVHNIRTDKFPEFDVPMLRPALILLLALTLPAAAQSSCRSISDSLERLRCYDNQEQAPAAPPATTGAPSIPPLAVAPKAATAALDFAKLKSRMNARYKEYFAHHNTTLIGSKTQGKHRVFYIRVPDPNPDLMITASCEPMDAGDWMCTLRPNYGSFGALPLQIK